MSLPGGGNTSVKDEKYLYVKPSGVALAKIKPENFVKMDRALIEKIFTHDMPSDVAQREAIAKEFMMAAVCPESSGRPSVEAPLHELIPFRYVVHLHPALVNGMTLCRKRRKSLCGTLPGRSLDRVCRSGIHAFTQSRGRDGSLQKSQRN